MLYSLNYKSLALYIIFLHFYKSETINIVLNDLLLIFIQVFIRLYHSKNIIFIIRKHCENIIFFSENDKIYNTIKYNALLIQ